MFLQWEGGRRVRLGILVIACCLLAAASGKAAMAASDGGNCALYARDVTGIHIEGNAGSWWDHAEGRYSRGHQPQIGAVLVFKPSPYMRAGHVAVVSRVLGAREIFVNQANWIPGRVVEDAAVFDASPNNDWTMVRVANIRTTTWGRYNPAFGFIYPNQSAASDRLIAAADRPDEDRVQAATRPNRLARADRVERLGTHPTRPPVRLASADPREQHHTRAIRVADEVAVIEPRRRGLRRAQAARPHRPGAKAASHHERIVNHTASRRIVHRDRVAQHAVRHHVAQPAHARLRHQVASLRHQPTAAPHLIKVSKRD